MQIPFSSSDSITMATSVYVSQVIKPCTHIISKGCTKSANVFWIYSFLKNHIIGQGN